MPINKSYDFSALLYRLCLMACYKIKATLKFKSRTFYTNSILFDWALRVRNPRSILGLSKSFRTEWITKYTLATINIRWEATQRVMAAKLTRLTHKIAIQLHLLAERRTIFSSRSRWLVRKLLDTPSYSASMPNPSVRKEFVMEMCWGSISLKNQILHVFVQLWHWAFL
jgi:hypothetical protein